MAFMSQERKAVIAAELKKVMPRDWKYSLAVRHHSTIVLTIAEAPIDLLTIFNEREKANYERRFPNDRQPYQPSSYAQLNEYHLDYEFSGDLLETFKRIKDAMNVGNHDNSDPMTDYFDVGWYVSIHIGGWNKPFRFVLRSGIDPQPGSAQYEALKARLEKLEANARPAVEPPKSDLTSCWRMPQAEA